MRTGGGVLAGNVVFGLAPGFSLSNIGFGDYAELNSMFTFQDRRMIYSFVGAVVLAAAGTTLLSSVDPWAARSWSRRGSTSAGWRG